MMVHIHYVDDVYIRIECDDGISQELSDYFSFMVPNAKFMPSFRNKMWDGKIRLFNYRSKLLYSGLRLEVQNFCKSRNYDYNEDAVFSADSFSVSEAKEYISSLSLSMEPRDYQIEVFTKGIRDRRRLFLSPTASGKSFIMYLLTRYLNRKTLIIVPTVSLVSQMKTDFINYDSTGEIVNEIHEIYAGKDKTNNKKIFISTWQSLYKLPKQWFKDFDVVLGDECHLFKSDSLTNIMNKLTDCSYKFGFTGTLDGSLTNKMILEGIFGPVEKVTTTATLMKENHIANLNIKCIVLDYDEQTRKLMKNASYQEEIDFIIQKEERNKFIANLAHSLNGNVLILFRYIEKQGDQLFGLINSKNKDRSGIYYVTGSMTGDKRNEIRSIVETQDRAIIAASIQTFGTGINIKNLHYIILATPSKSKITVLQSIGRGLRKSDTKSDAVWFDIADDLSWKSHKNHTLKHYAERVKLYNEENFNYKQYKVSIK